MCCFIGLFTQISFSQNANTLPPAGNVGVGTTTPSVPLDVVGGTKLGGTVVIDSTVVIKDSLTINKRLTIKQDIKVVGKSVFVDDVKAKANLRVLGVARMKDRLVVDSVARMKNKLVVDGLTRLNGDAKVFGDFKLSVEGKIRARSVQVDATNITWYDYIFAKDHQLSSLLEVENYINKHRHLPDVPSEKEIKENGIDLGEMDAVLLRKIEELTLYMIDLKKGNDELKLKVKQLEEDK